MLMLGYEVKDYPHGKAIFGAVPLSELTALMEIWGPRYRDGVIDALIAQKISASMVIATVEGSKAWRKELGIPITKPTDPPKSEEQA